MSEEQSVLADENRKLAEEVKNHLNSVQKLQDKIDVLRYHTSVFEYYAKRQYIQNPADFSFFKNRKCLTKELTSNVEFQTFWSEFNQKKEFEDYCEHLLSPRRRFEPEVAIREYEKYLQRKELDRLAADCPQTFKNAVSSWRQDAYRLWVEDMAYEDGSNDFIFPSESRIENLEKNTKPFRLENLPTDVFIRILNYMTPFDIFKLSSVCKTWKNLLCENQCELKHAEYLKASYVVEKISWEHVFESMMDSSLEEKYGKFSSNLIDWFLKHFNKVETLVLHHGIKFKDLATILERCPCLKHLVMHEYAYCSTGTTVHSKLFYQLEMLVFHNTGDYNYRKLVKELQERCKNLRILHCETLSWNQDGSSIICQADNVLSNMAALELTQCGRRVLQEMRKTMRFNLKYLKLELHHNLNWRPRDLGKKFGTRGSLNDLLSTMPDLKVLILPDHTLSLNRSTLRLITELEMDLQFGIFWTDSVATFFTPATKTNKDTIVDFETLNDFKKMLLLQDRNKNLADIVFVEADPIMRQEFIAMDLGFTFSSTAEFSQNTIVRLKSSFEDPILYKYLNLRY